MPSPKEYRSGSKPEMILRSGATTTDLAWAAGLFEGEGCVTKNGRKNLSLQINMTDEDVLRKFHSVVSVGWISGPHARGKHKPAWCWKVTSFQNVQAVIALLWNWMCARRRARATELLVWYLARPLAGQWKITCSKGHAFSVHGGWSCGQRYCRICKAVRNRRSYAKRKVNAQRSVLQT